MTPSGRWRAWLVALAISCGGSATAPPPDPGTRPAEARPGERPPAAPFARRPVGATVDGRPVREGIAYGPYREGQSPDGAQPSADQLLEDLRLLSPRWHMMRVYGAQGPTATVLRLIREHGLPIRVMLGAWVEGERPGDDRGDPLATRASANEREVEAAIRLANEYPDVVFALCVGNETQVSWSAHRLQRSRLVALIRRARAAVAQPVTTADDFSFWQAAESHAMAREIDFIVLHAYAMWNRQTLEEAVPWTRAQVAATRRSHPGVPVYLGETGWATRVHPSGDAARQIVGRAGEAEQAVFYAELTAWAREADLPHFYFEAFDEPWKGGPHPDEVEKHWGLFRVDRTPKAAMRQP